MATVLNKIVLLSSLTCKIILKTKKTPTYTAFENETASYITSTINKYPRFYKIYKKRSK